MAHNRYIANCEIVPIDDGVFRGHAVHGEFRFDPQAMIEPHCIPSTQMGKPSEMVLHIAGVTHYPTARGYVRVER